jgi:hypothetical protein
MRAIASCVALWGDSFIQIWKNVFAYRSKSSLHRLDFS